MSSQTLWGSQTEYLSLHPTWSIGHASTSICHQSFIKTAYLSVAKLRFDILKGLQMPAIQVGEVGAPKTKIVVVSIRIIGPVLLSNTGNHSSDDSSIIADQIMENVQKSVKPHLGSNEWISQPSILIISSSKDQSCPSLQIPVHARISDGKIPGKFSSLQTQMSMQGSREASEQWILVGSTDCIHHLLHGQTSGSLYMERSAQIISCRSESRSKIS